MKSTNNNAVILARVSSKAQAIEGYSIEAQSKLLVEYVKREKLNLVHAPFEVAESAKTKEKRIVFQQMMDYIKKNDVKHLVVEKVDRFVRNFHDAVDAHDWLMEDSNRKIHFVKDSLIMHKDSRSQEWLNWGIRVVMAKNYSDNLREEVAKGVKEKLAEGWLPGKSPIGYKTVGDTGKKIHVIDHTVSPLVKNMFEKYLEPSNSIEKLSKDMAELGLKTKYGKPLSRSHVQKVLKNPFYIGVNRWCGVDYPNGKQEPLISKDVFDAVQMKMQRKNPPKYNKHNPDYKGLFTCINCGGMVTWEQHKGFWYGHCNSHGKYNGCPKQKWIRQDNVEKELVGMFDLLVCPSPAIMDWVKNALKARHEATMHIHHASTEQLRSQLDIITRKKDILYEDRLAERIDSEGYDKRYKDLIQNEVDTKSSLDNVDDFANRQFEHGMKILDLSQKASMIYVDRSPEQKRIILTRLFSNLSINGPVLEVELSELAVAIADKVKIHQQLVKKFELTKNDLDNRGRGELTESLRTIWLGC